MVQSGSERSTRCEAVTRVAEWPYARRCSGEVAWQNVPVRVGDVNPGIRSIDHGKTGSVVLDLCEAHARAAQE